MFIDDARLYKKPCKEIFKLKRMLEKAKIPFDFIEGFGYDKATLSKYPDIGEHYHICYPVYGNGQRISVIEGFGSYGREQDRLEIMGGLTPWEKWDRDDSVIGYLTAKNVFKRIEKDWKEGCNNEKNSRSDR